MTTAPYIVTLTQEGPIGPTAVVTGPGDYRSMHGGGRDGGKAAAQMQAAELNRAYLLGVEAAPAHLEQLVKIAGAILLEAPERPTTGQATARVAWQLMQRLEAALRALGVDLDAARKRYDRLGTQRAARGEAYRKNLEEKQK